MKRIATIGAIITAFAVAPSVAAAGNVSAQVKAQVSAQVIGVQTAKAQRATAAISAQRHLVQIARAERFALHPSADPLVLLTFHPRGRGPQGPFPRAQRPTMSSGRTGTRASSRPVASRSAATIAAVDTTVGGSPTPFTP